MLLKLAWRNLWRNKRRTFITMASVIFAVLLAVFMRSMQEGSYARILENVVGGYTGFIQVHKAGYWDDQVIDNVFTPPADLQMQLSDNELVKGVAPRLESFALVASDSMTKGVMVMGIDPAAEDRRSDLASKVVEGQYFNQDDKTILVAQGLAEQLEVSVGDTLVLLGQGYHGVSAAGKYAIAAIARFGNPDMNRNITYLPLATAQELYGAPGMLSSLNINLYDMDDTDEVVEQIRAKLSKDYEVMGWKEIMPDLKQALEADESSGKIVLGILYLIIGFGVFGTILMMIAEREYEFGILISIGMKHIKLGFIVVLETMMIAIMGTLGGFVLSIPFVLYFRFNPWYLTGSMQEASENFGFEAVMITSTDPAIFVEQSVVVLALVLVLAFYPLISISRLDPIKAMKR